MSQIQSGIDPTSGPPESGITLKQALAAHLSEKKFSPRTVEGYEYHLDHYLIKFRNRAVTDISRQDVRELFDMLKKQRGETAAANAMRTLRAVINTARRIDETIGGNPVAALRVPAPKLREVDALDIDAWWPKLDKLTGIRRDVHVAMMLTGARRSSLLQVKREDVDLEKGVLTFRHMKIGGQMMFPMGERLTERLRLRMKADVPLNSPWLWPSAYSATGHVTEPKEPDHDLPSPHEYRHHARTLFIASGVPYAESALLLGQKLPGASGGYVHAEHLVEHLRQHAQALENLVHKNILKR
jgi:integrase